MCERFYDLSKAWPVCGLYMATFADELQQTLVQTVVGAQLLAAFDFGPNLWRIEAVEGHFPLEGLPKESAESEDVDLLRVSPLLKELGSHVARRAGVLHRAGAEIGLNQAQMSASQIGVALTMKRASPKSHTLTLKLASMSTLWLLMSRCTMPRLCM